MRAADARQVTEGVPIPLEVVVALAEEVSVLTNGASVVAKGVPTLTEDQLAVGEEVSYAS